MSCSQMEVQAFTSMMVVSLPFPPMPVVCIKSSESNDSHASSHDVLSSAIASMIVGNDNKAGGGSMETFERKQSILLALNDNIADVWGNRDKSNEIVALEECYAVFCRHFRMYMACYAGCRDLRIMDMDSVCAGDVIVKQAVQHLNAIASTFAGEEGDIEECTVPLESTNNYKALIRLYVLGIYSLSRESQHRHIEVCDVGM